MGSAFRNTVRPPTADALTIDYFALGDSAPASADGIVDNTPCKRSTQSYPLQVGHALAMRHDKVFFYRLACWGTAYSGNAAAPDSSIRHQVDQILPTISSRPTLNTITFGANELRITDPVFVFLSFCLSLIAIFRTGLRESSGTLKNGKWYNFHVWLFY